MEKPVVYVKLELRGFTFVDESQETAVYEHLTGGPALATPVLQDVADFDSKMRIEKVECKIPLSLCHYEVEGLSDRQKKK